MMRAFRRLDLDSYAENDQKAKQEHLDRLAEIENQLDVDFGTVSVEVDDSGGEDNSSENGEGSGKMCIVCNKSFKSEKSFSNHQRSKKHKQALEVLRKHMQEEDRQFFAELDPEENKEGEEEG